MKLRRKVDEWIASIEDEALREQVKPAVIVTGGWSPAWKGAKDAV